jgi:hypothetical protein
VTTPSGRTAAPGLATPDGEEPAGAGRPPATRSARAIAAVRDTHPAVQGLIALVIYLVIWVLTETLPLLAHPGRPQLDQTSMDPNFYIWDIRWWPYALGHGLNPLYTTMIGAPAGHNLAWITTIPPLALLMTPVTLVVGPVVSFSLLVVAAIPTSGWAAFVLCRRLTGKFWPALVGGGIYGFSAYEMNHVFSGQLNLAVSMLIPLMVYFAVLWRDHAIGSRMFVALLAIALTLQTYLFLETFAELTGALAVAFIVGYVAVGRGGRPLVTKLVVRTVLAYVISIVLSSPFLIYALKHVPAGFQRSPSGPSLKLAGLIVPWPGQDLGLTWLAHLSTDLPGPGLDGYLSLPLILVALALPFVVASRRTAWFLVVTLVLIIIAALGPALHIDAWKPVFNLPWGSLWNLPVARSAYPARFMVFAQLLMAVIVALWLAKTGRSKLALSGRWLLAALGIAAIVANTPALDLGDQTGLPAFVTTGEYHTYLTPGETVVTLSQRGNTGMLWQAAEDYYAREGGGYINQAISTNGGVPQQVANLRLTGVTAANLSTFRAYLKASKIGAILVEEDHAGPWPALLDQAGLHDQAVGGVLVYKVPASY